MKSIYGDHIQFCLFGESHSETIGIVINSLPAGIKLDLDHIKKQLEKRKPHPEISTCRVEADDFKIVSGFFNGYTTGTPLCIMIENKSQKSGDYEKTKSLLRPSHADYTAYKKYFGYQDYRGGGHFSGRLTAPIVIAGAICTQILNSKGIFIGTHISKLNSIYDSAFSTDETSLRREIEYLNEQYFPVLNKNIANDMIELIKKAKADGDSIGGTLNSAIIGIEAGIGEPFFSSVESKLSSLLFSVPGIKGVEFGAGFSFADMYGSEANDSFYYDGKKIKTISNNNGGINGGITNSMPIMINIAVKPTPSIFKPQKTVDITTNHEETLLINGRHDPAIIHRARVVVDSVLAMGLVDLFCERYGYLWLAEK